MILLERRGRLPQHTYLDYTLTNLMAAVIIAFTFGEVGNTAPNFLSQLHQVLFFSPVSYTHLDVYKRQPLERLATLPPTSCLNSTSLWRGWQHCPQLLVSTPPGKLAFSSVCHEGGVVLSVGNLSTQYAWAFVGLSVVEVIRSSITVVIRTTFNYFLDDKINKAEILFPGVGCFLIAVCLGSAVHSSNSADNKAKLNEFSADYKDAAKNTTLTTSIETSEVDSKDLEDGSTSVHKAKAGTAAFLIELEKKRSIKASGLGVAVVLGELIQQHAMTDTFKAISSLGAPPDHLQISVQKLAV
ncbi:Ureide permease [Vigna unguiculata]|uniref:Ureide permease n=1 Tax=Vigna unguiculata TaxID=3917 RepID=A0A4D6MGP5_VIGUN|nr:Ureide permease [Vigna unguiculata]